MSTEQKKEETEVIPAEETVEPVKPEVIVESIEELPAEKVEEPKEAKNEYDELLEIIALKDKEIEKYKHYSRKNETENRELNLIITKNKVVKEFGLPEASIALLEGKNEEQIKGKAEALKALLGTQTDSKIIPELKPNPLQGMSGDEVNSSNNVNIMRELLNKKLNKPNN